VKRALRVTLAGIIAIAATVSVACSSGPPFQCGNQTCSGDEYCLHPCCGGAADAGACTPPPPVCKPSPNDCQSVSGGGVGEIQGRDVYCGGCA
jgi:hypothetical protein